MAFLADRYKTPFTWGAEEMAKTAVYPEKSVLKSQVFNSVVVAVIAVSGTWGIGQRVAGMLNPINALNVPEAAEQASLFVGAYLLGLYFIVIPKINCPIVVGYRAPRTGVFF